MGLIDTLRKAEEQGRGAAHRGLEKARGTWDNAERRLRRKMRMRPPRSLNENPPEPMPSAIRPPVSTSAKIANQTLATNRASEEDAA
jgi:hypothetical protein